MTARKPSASNAAPATADELATHLRASLLSPPPSRLTRDVEEWAASSALVANDRVLLDLYREAYERQKDALFAELRAATAEGPPRLAAIGILNRTAVSDAEKLFVLDVLDGTLTAAEVGRVAGAVLNQRASVARRAAEVISQVSSGESLFALRKVLGSRPDEAGETAGRLADGAASHDAINPTDALFYALAATADEVPEAPSEALADAAGAVDAELQSAGRTAQGLSGYQQILRHELHLFTLLSGISQEDELGRRARGTLFSGTPLDRVRSAAPRLSEEILTEYCERALSKTNRRKRLDRAELALDLLSATGDEPRRACLDELRECLTEDAVELRFGAARALALSPGELTNDDRSAVGEAYAQLAPEWQERLAPFLSDLLPDDVVLDVPALSRWLLAAAETETRDRFETGLQRWDSARAINAAGVAELASNLLALGERLDDREQDDARSAVAGRIARWLAKSRSNMRGAVITLVGSPGIAELLCERFWSSGIAELSPGVLRAVLPVSLAATGAPAEALAELVDHATADGAAFRSALLELLGGALDLDDAFGKAMPTGRSELLLALLRGTTEIVVELPRLEAVLAEKTTEALEASREAVEEALNAALDASSGNENLQRHLLAIQQATGFVDIERARAAPSEAVMEWRRSAADQSSGAVLAADATVPLQVATSNRESLPELLRLIEELDRRANARGVISSADRVHHISDLENVVRGALDATDGKVPPELARVAARRPELARLVWSVALESVADTAAALSQALGHDEDPRRAVLVTDILLERATDDDLVQAVRTLDEQEFTAAWSRVTSLYKHHRRERDTLKDEISRQTEDVMDKIATELDLPFQAIESILFGYFRLRAILREAGWGQIAENLGEIIPKEGLDFDRFEVAAGEPSDRYVVRSLGISVLGRPARRAIVEPT